MPRPQHLVPIFLDYTQDTPQLDRIEAIALRDRHNGFQPELGITSVSLPKELDAIATLF
jgi:hypothetical protein